MDLISIGMLALITRIFLLSTERIFLKQLDEYDPLDISAIFFLTASIALLPIFLFLPNETFQTGLDELGYALISSIIYSVGFYSYVKAMSQEDASLISPLYNSSLLWLLLLGLFVLGEDVDFFRISGGILMFFGVFFLYPGQFSEKYHQIRKSNASMLMIFGSLFLALGRTVDTLAIRDIDPRIYAFAINLFVGIFYLILALTKNSLDQGILAIREKPKTVIYASVSNGWAYLMLLVAISYLEVTIAEPASLLSIFVTAYLAKKVLNEDVEQRIPGMVLMVFGAILLFV